MKATVDTVELREALKKVYPLRINKQLPSLSNALVEFADSKATLTATDLSVGVRVDIASKSDEPFKVLLPMRTTATFLNGANGSVVIGRGKSEKDVILKRDMGELSLITSPLGDFPHVPKPENLKWSKWDAKWFCHMAGIVSMACATEESRPILTGVHCKDGAIAAADGFRLHTLKDSQLDFGLGEKDAIIPLTTITKMRRVFGKDEEFEVAFEEALANSFATRVTAKVRRVYFRSGDTLMVSEAIQGTYPKYEQLIPQSYECTVSFSAPVMAQRLGMVGEKNVASGVTRFVFQEDERTEKHECILKAENNDFGHYELSMPVKITSKEGGKIAFNMRYIIDALKAFSLVNLELTTVSSPGKFTGDIEGLTIVIMPMFVQW